MSFSFGDIVDAVSSVVSPSAPAFVHGERVISWGDAKKRMNNIARNLHAKGAKPGDKVAFYMRNGIEYGELTGACFVGSMTHVNVNYRYKPDEVRYILDNSDAQTVVYGAEFRDVIAEIRPRLTKVQTFVEVTDGAPAPFAERFDDLANEGDGTPLKLQRSPQDEFFIYTGGTTGMPKGVIWRHEDIFKAAMGGGDITQLELQAAQLEEALAAAGQRPPPVNGVAAPDPQLVAAAERAAAEQARREEDARRQAVKAEQAKINERTGHDFETRIAAARASAERLRDPRPI